MGIGADMRFAYRLLFLFRSIHETVGNNQVIYKIRYSGYYSRIATYDTKYNYRFD